MMLILTPEDQQKLAEIQRLLDEAYEHYFTFGDGHCKSSEGHVAINFNNYFERRGGETTLRLKGVEVYSYVLGPSRTHYFDSIDDALKTVRKWHKAEMEHDYSDDI